MRHSAMRCLRRSAMRGLHRSAMRGLRLFVCSQGSHFCRKAEPCDKNHKNSRFFWQKIHKFALILCVFTFQKFFHALLGVFSAFKCIFIASPKHFQPSKVLSRLAWRVFSLQKYFHCLPEAFSPFKRTFVAPLGAVLGFKSIFIASPRRFQPSKVLLLLRSAYFGVQKFFCCLPEAISGFKRTFVASPKCFHLSKVLLRLASQRDALFTDFLFARNARIFVSQRSALLTEFSCGKLALIFLQKPQKFAPFTAKSTKIRVYSVCFHLSKAVSIRFRQK